MRTLFLFVLFAIIGTALSVSVAMAQDKPSEIDLRVSAMAQHYEAQLAQAARSGATLAAELAAMQAKLKGASEAADKCKSPTQLGQ